MDFFGCRLVRARCPKFRGDEDAAELGEHVRCGRVGLGRVPGGAGAVIVEAPVATAVTCPWDPGVLETVASAVFDDDQVTEFVRFSVVPSE